MLRSSRQRRVPWSPEGPAGPTLCVFKAPRTYTPVLDALVSPLTWDTVAACSVGGAYNISDITVFWWAGRSC